MAEYDGEKSQDATPHRRQQAREEGHIAKSQDLGSAALLIVGLLSLWMLGNGLVEFVVHYCRQQLGGEAWLATDPAAAASHAYETLGGLGRALVPLLGLLVAAGVAVNLAQSGLLFLPEKLVPDITRLDPLQGMKRHLLAARIDAAVLRAGEAGDRRHGGAGEPLRPARRRLSASARWASARSPC